MASRRILWSLAILVSDVHGVRLVREFGGPERMAASLRSGARVGSGTNICLVTVGDSEQRQEPHGECLG